MLLMCKGLEPMGEYLSRLDLPERQERQLPNFRTFAKELRGAVKHGEFSWAKRQWNDYYGDLFCCLAMYPAVKVWTYRDGKRERKEFMPERVCGLFLTKLPREKFISPRRAGDDLRGITDLVVVSPLLLNSDPEIAEKGLRDFSVYVRYRDAAGEWAKEVHLPEAECPRWGTDLPETPAKAHVPDSWRYYDWFFTGLKTEV